MFYLDTSFVVSALTREPNSASARLWLRDRAVASCVVSDWVVTEVASALALKQRTGQHSEQERDAALSFFNDRFLETLDLRPVVRQHFFRATEMVGIKGHQLRAADALHLAIAEAGKQTIVTYDTHQFDAAHLFGIAAISP